MAKIDALDKKIVDLLIEDGRMPCSEIAQRIGEVSERAVRYRINRMISQGIFDVSAQVNAKSLGFRVVADVFVEVEPQLVLEIAHQLAGLEWVSYVACSTGERDISVQLFAHDNDEMYLIVTDVIGKIPGVRRTRTSLVPMVIKDDAKWRIPSNCASLDVPQSLKNPRNKSE
jgi:Lrp/AsnC family transcriptional regulator for asnA, asnC and gidA